MAEKQKTKYPNGKWIIGSIVALFALVYLGAAWFPGVVRLAFNIEGVTGDGQFGGFGTIGDFFGGVVNPILTFITIYLLLVSIRIQREELEATRAEMQAATAQAEISANAAQASILINKIAERPYLVVMGYDPTFFVIGLKIRNYGKSAAIIKNINVYLDSGSIRKKINEDLVSGLIVDVYIHGNESFKLNTVIKDEKFLNSKFGNILLGHENSKNMFIEIEVIYFDYFMQDWVTVIRGESGLNGNGFYINPGKIYSDRSEALDTLAMITEASKLHGENRNDSRPSRLHPDR